MSRLERLLKLAQKTGDTLIVHDASSRDMVIMDVTMYEVLHDMYGMREDMTFSEHECDCHHEDVALMSEGEMLDKINRDIATWRSYQEEDEQWDRAHMLEESLMDEPLFDPFAEDYSHDPAWHSAGDILQDRASAFDIPVEQIKSTNDSSDVPVSVEDVVLSEPAYEELGEASLGSPDKMHIPFVSHDDVVDSDEESLTDDDEPVFFEEPI